MYIRGIVVGQTDRREHDRLVVFYTQEFGKITALAKSLKKNTSKQAAHLEPLNLVDFHLRAGRRWPLVVSAESREVFRSIRSSLAKSSAGFFLLETINRLVYEGESDWRLWGFLRRSLFGLEAAEFSALDLTKLINRWSEELMNILGYHRSLKPEDLLEPEREGKFYARELINVLNFKTENEQITF